jgi:hypothetical protein
MKQLHIAHLSYAYRSYKVPGCDSHDGVAYVLAQPDLIPDSNIQVLTPEPPASGPAHDEAVMISKMAMNVGGTNPYPSLYGAANAVGDDQYKAWLGKHIQGCEKLAPPEPVAMVDVSPCRQVASGDVSERVSQLGSQLGSMSNVMLNAQASLKP